MRCVVVYFPGWTGRLCPMCHQTRGDPSTSLRLVIDSIGLDAIANSRPAHDSSSVPPGPVRYESANIHVCFILARLSYDPKLAEVSSIGIQLRPIFTCSLIEH